MLNLERELRAAPRHADRLNTRSGRAARRPTPRNRSPLRCWCRRSRAGRRAARSGIGGRPCQACGVRGPARGCGSPGRCLLSRLRQPMGTRTAAGSRAIRGSGPANGRSQLG